MLDATPSEQIFQRDRYWLQEQFAVADNRTIADENGKPLLVMRCPPRLGRLVVAVVGATVVFFLTGMLGMPALIATGNRGLLGILVLIMVTTLAALFAFAALLGKQVYRFFTPLDNSHPLLEIHPEICLGPSSCYEVVDEQGACLARLQTNHLANVLRARWNVYRPDGQLWVVAEEDTVIPMFIRRPLRGGMVLLSLSLLLGSIFMPDMGPLQGPLLIALTVLLLLGRFFSRGLLLLSARVIRSLLPNCTFFKPDLCTVVGELARQGEDQKQHNVLDMRRDPEHSLDRRVAVAVAVLMFKT